jgi:hypothetical protein
MPLAEIERLNGKPFLLSGFGWDYGGTAHCGGHFAVTPMLPNAHAVIRTPGARGDHNPAARAHLVPAGDAAAAIAVHIGAAPTQLIGLAVVPITRSDAGTDWANLPTLPGSAPKLHTPALPERRGASGRLTGPFVMMPL